MVKAQQKTDVMDVDTETAKRFKYQIGDTVICINDNGVNLGVKKIIGRQLTGYGSPAYYIEPTDTPWYRVPESNLKEVAK